MSVLLPSAALATVSQEGIYIYLQLIAVFSLMFLLIVRELTINIRHPYICWRQVSLIGVLPLLFAFLLILVWHINYSA